MARLLNNPFLNEVRENSYKARAEIGFLQKYEDWIDAPAAFSEHTLVINGHPVMEDWEDGYMKELASIACMHGGKVLEVGFGMGISATHISKFEVAEHLIIESNSDVFEKLKDFAAVNKRVTSLKGFWQDLTPMISSGSLSGILFDTYPLTQQEVHCNHFAFFKEAWRLLRTGGILTYYSDEVRDFSSQHLSLLHRAGFKDIRKKVITVSPPRDCAYWQSATIVAPIITK